MAPLTRRGILTGAGLCCLALLVWRGPTAPTAPPMVGTLPLLAGHEININVWPAPFGLRIVLWHQTPAANVPLVRFTLPAWPLILGVGLVALVALWWPPHRAATRRREWEAHGSPPAHKLDQP